jgi:L-lactate utilization protein LutC
LGKGVEDNVTLFDKLYAMTDEEKKGTQKPLVLKKVNRALDAAADSYESSKIDLHEKIGKLLGELANGKVDVVKDLISARLELSETDTQLEEVKKIQVELSGEVRK